jgi:hypothetical protein
VLIQSMPRSFKDALKSVRQKIAGGKALQPLKPTYPLSSRGVGFAQAAVVEHYGQGLAELLRYADRNSMAHSREVRMPFLDHRLVEFVFTLPEACLHRQGWTKWILREAIKGMVPEPIRQRVDKLGYMPPQERWLGPLIWEDVMTEQLTRFGQRPLPGCRVPLELRRL